MMSPGIQSYGIVGTVSTQNQILPATDRQWLLP
jgi:hypothetical protein